MYQSQPLNKGYLTNGGVFFFAGLPTANKNNGVPLGFLEQKNTKRGGPSKRPAKWKMEPAKWKGDPEQGVNTQGSTRKVVLLLITLRTKRKVGTLKTCLFLCRLNSRSKKGCKTENKKAFLSFGGLGFQEYTSRYERLNDQIQWAPCAGVRRVQ